jgi:hypothetical protein
MSADALLTRLEKVKSTGANRWIARCPAHDDRTPSLAIRELEDGRVLIRCFAECETHAVLDAVGLSFDALYPERQVGDRPRERRPFNAIDILRCIGFESLVVAVAAGNLHQGMALTDADYNRLMLASGRIQRAVDMVNE